MTEIKLQQKRINESLTLIQQNPNLQIVPMVDSELGGSDFAWYMGKWVRQNFMRFTMRMKEFNSNRQIQKN